MRRRGEWKNCTEFCIRFFQALSANVKVIYIFPRWNRFFRVLALSRQIKYRATEREEKKKKTKRKWKNSAREFPSFTTNSWKLRQRNCVKLHWTARKWRREHRLENERLTSLYTFSLSFRMVPRIKWQFHSQILRWKETVDTDEKKMWNFRPRN